MRYFLRSLLFVEQYEHGNGIRSTKPRYAVGIPHAKYGDRRTRASIVL